MTEETNTGNGYKPWGMEVNQFCMLMHLAGFAGYIIPFAGLALPIIMWATNKDQSPLVDEHGKNIVNWIISSIIYVTICSILVIVFIGFFLLLAFALISILFTVLAAIKASNGEVYKYPLAITFLK